MRQRRSLAAFAAAATMLAALPSLLAPLPVQAQTGNTIDLSVDNCPDLDDDCDFISEDNPVHLKVKVTATLQGEARTTDIVVTLDTTLEGTATSGTDYLPLRWGSSATAAQTSITIPAGEQSGTVKEHFGILPLSDDLVEGNETIIVSGSATGFTVNDLTLCLLDDDSSPAPEDSDCTGFNGGI